MESVVDLYHTKLPTLRRCEVLTATRVSLIKQRTQEHLPTLTHWDNYFTHVSRCPFLLGKEAAGFGRTKPFKADLEWLARPGNFAKVAEGKYET